MKRFEPTFYCKSIFDIPMSFYKEHGIHLVLSDLDNTLDAFDVLEPSSRVKELKENLEKEGIELCIVSNNKEKHKKVYCTRLGVKGIFSCRKPFSKKVSRFIEELGYSKENVLLIGDQLLTDVGCAYHGGLSVVLTDPIVKKDQWTTKFNRLLDRPIRRRLRKSGYLDRVKVPYGK